MGAPISPPNSIGVGNRLLDRLPSAEMQRLSGEIQQVSLPFKQVIYQAREPIQHTYFITSGIASAIATARDGRAVEVATIGNEGMLGLPAAFGETGSPNQIVMQVAGTALRISTAALAAERANNTPLYQTLIRYHAAYLTQISQSVACNGLHTVKHRCCRWLLATHDRFQADEIPLTHEFLAIMLGVRRASVSEVLRPLQKQGMLSSGRGRITIMNRPALESCACECYRTVVDEYRRLLG
ncbi:MAG: Crp/Fnr family transcriptional regulator [Gemmataceae bacterium]